MRARIAVVAIIACAFAGCSALGPPDKRESCGNLTFGADGTAGPVFCPDGRPNAKADAHYRALDLRVFALGRKATSADVHGAICADFRDGRTSIPIEMDSVELVEKEHGWHFATDPAQHMDRTAEDCLRSHGP